MKRPGHDGNSDLQQQLLTLFGRNRVCGLLQFIGGLISSILHGVGSFLGSFVGGVDGIADRGTCGGSCTVGSLGGFLGCVFDGIRCIFSGLFNGALFLDGVFDSVCGVLGCILSGVCGLFDGFFGSFRFLRAACGKDEWKGGEC